MIIYNPRILISAGSSGSGKTTVTCGILKALKDRGIGVSSCKCGPDYIDPMFHKRVLGIPSKNLDPFFEDKNLMGALYAEHVSGSDLNVIEGVMGYYDGLGFDGTRASTYEVGRNLGAPVILVINARGMALTLIAVLKGIMDFRSDSNIRGVILNNVSEMVYKSMAPVIERETGVIPLGFLPSCPEIAVESRHLGLMTPDSVEDLNSRIEKLGQLTEKCIDLDRLIALAESAEAVEYSGIPKPTLPDKEKIRIAVAEDDAFCFYYEDNLELLQEYGCEIVPFSPLDDKCLPENISGLILGGGYPELYAERLSKNISMRESILSALKGGLPCLAECGGFMYLHDSMEDNERIEHRMAGFLSGEKCVKREKLVRFGYITLSVAQYNPLLEMGEEIKAHEFHYWDSTDNGDLMKADKPSGKRSWECIRRINNTFCGFPHIFYRSNPRFAERFVNLCRENGANK